MVIEMSINWYTMGQAAVALVILSTALNALVDWLGERVEGYTSLLVVAGVTQTIVIFAIVESLGAAIKLFILFAVAGIPMIIGEVKRAIVKRNFIRREAEREAWLSQNQ